MLIANRMPRMLPLVFLVGCSGPFEGELLIGEVKSCFHPPPCFARTVYRDGDRLALVATHADTGEFVQRNEGRLTALGREALANAAVAYGPELAASLSSCANADGDDIVIVLERSGERYELQYCADTDQLAELTDLATGIREALERCEPNGYVVLDDCTALAMKGP